MIGKMGSKKVGGEWPQGQVEGWVIWVMVGGEVRGGKVGGGELVGGRAVGGYVSSGTTRSVTPSNRNRKMGSKKVSKLGND
jgi:hypothetical protein